MLPLFAQYDIVCLTLHVSPSSSAPSSNHSVDCFLHACDALICASRYQWNRLHTRWWYNSRDVGRLMCYIYNRDWHERRAHDNGKVNKCLERYLRLSCHAGSPRLQHRIFAATIVSLEQHSFPVDAILVCTSVQSPAERINQIGDKQEKIPNWW